MVTAVSEPISGFNAIVHEALRTGNPRMPITQLGAIAFLQGCDIDHVAAWIIDQQAACGTTFIDRNTGDLLPQRDVSRALQGAIGHMLYTQLEDAVLGDLNDMRLHALNLHGYGLVDPHDAGAEGTLSTAYIEPRNSYSISLQGKKPTIPFQHREGIDIALRIMRGRLERAARDASLRPQFTELRDACLPLLGYQDVDATLRRDWTLDFGLQQSLTPITAFWELLKTATNMSSRSDGPFAGLDSRPTQEDAQRLARATLLDALQIAATYRFKMQHGMMNIGTASGEEYRSKFKPNAVGILLQRAGAGDWQARVPNMEFRAENVGYCPAQETTFDVDLENIGMDWSTWFDATANPIAMLNRSVFMTCAEPICRDFSIFGATIGARQSDAFDLACHSAKPIADLASYFSTQGSAREHFQDRMALL